jgi:hypothetical protein
MKTMHKVKKKKVRFSRYDPALDKYEGVVLFPEKLAKANEDIKNSNFEEFRNEFLKKQNKH